MGDPGILTGLIGRLLYGPYTILGSVQLAEAYRSKITELTSVPGFLGPNRGPSPGSFGFSSGSSLSVNCAQADSIFFFYTGSFPK